MYHNGRRRLLVTTILVTAMGQASMALAEEIVKTSDEARSSGFALEEIVVTSRKRAENLQDVPDAINTFSAGMIEGAGISSVGDFTSMVSNMSFINSQNKGTVSINIRGIGQVRNGDAPVAMIIDGVQISSPNQITQELYDIERIEVLKGPQGALYGRNAIGGAINIVTKEPTNEFENFLRLSATNGFGYKVQGGSSGAIVKDKLLFRVAGSYEDDNGVIQNVTLNRDVDFFKDRNIRGRLLFYPAERLTLDLRASYSKFDGGQSWYIPLADDDANNTSAPVEANILGSGNRKLQDYTLKIDYDFDFATLTSISAYSKTYEFFFEDLDWLAAPILAAEQALDVEALSQEVRLISPSEQRLRWMVGGYYLDTKRDIDTNVFLDFGDSLLSVANPRDHSHNKAAAGFGQASYDIVPELELTLALRYDSDKREQTSLNTGLVSAKTFGAWQPKVSLAYHWTDDAMTYVTVGRGFRSGGFNQATASFGQLYQAETNWNYEIGLKTKWLENRLEINGAIFWTDFDNQHVFVLDAATAAQGIINVNKTRIKGGELEFRARPFRDLELSGGIGLMNADIRDFNNTGLYNGNQSPLVNEWSYNFAVEYTRSIADDYAFFARVNYNAAGDLAWHIDNMDRQKAYHLVDARVGLKGGDAWTVTLFATNLLKEKYTAEFFANEFTGLVADIRWPNNQRRYGIETVLRF